MSIGAQRRARGKRARRRRRTAEEARRLILDATEKRFLAGGPGAIRLQDIAADVRLSHPAILHHFGSRDGLIEALVVRAIKELQEEVLAALASGEIRGIADLLERFFRITTTRGYARLLSWLILEGKEVRALEPGAVRPLADALHAARLMHNRARGWPPPAFADTLFASALMPVTLLGDALFGALMRRGVGLPEDADVARQFRVWLARLLTEHRFEPVGEREEPPLAHPARRAKGRRRGDS
jgi:AcrR family transcriptional regulator